MKKVLIVLLFIPSILFGQIEFFKKNIIDETNATIYPESVIASDLDGDGYKDLIIADSGKLVWQKNLDGLGNFSTLKYIDTGFSYSNIFSIDIDNDGDNDIVSNDGYSIRVYKNNGIGEFTSSYNISIESEYNIDRSSSTYLSDIDGDGLSDIISCTLDGFVWFKNLDGTNFSDSQTISSRPHSYYVYSSDIDNDGDMDIIGAAGADATYVNGVTWYENTNGIGTNWVLHGIISNNSNQNNKYISPLTIDIENDGDLDIIFAENNYNNSRLIVKKNNGSDVFNQEITLATPINEIEDICITDINNDGLLDIVTISGSWERKVFWFRNLGTGSFSGQNEIAQTNNISQNSSFSSVISSDLDNDGKKDIIYTDLLMNEVFWNKNIDTQGAFNSKKSTVILSDYPVFTLFSDIDNDGDLDVYSLSYAKLAWHENLDGNGNFGLQKTIYRGEIYNKMIAINIDNDNDDDLILCGNDKISLFKNNNGTYDRQLLGHQANVKSISKNDIDNDGDFDFVISSISNKISWFENLDGLGSFSEHIISSDSTRNHFCIDLDNDGDLDIVSCFNNEIKWFENLDGLGNFGSGGTLTTLYNPKVVSFYDFDDDGDLDLLSYGHDFVWFENLDGLGNFGSVQIIDSDYPPVKDIKIDDIDNDGVKEIITYTEHGINIYQKYNNYTKQHIYQSRITNLNITDLDNDEDLDIIYCGGEDNEISWYKNLNVLSNEINGNLKFDINNDCANSNMRISNIMINTNNGIDYFSTISQENGDYLLSVNEGNFTTSVNLPNYFTANPNSQTNTFTGFDNTFTADFCIEVNQTVNDVNVSLLPVNQARPGFDASYQIVYTNFGTTQLNGDVGIEFDETKLSFLNASEIISSQTSNSLSFDFFNLNPFETRTIDLAFNVNTPTATQPVNIDDILNFTATINPITSDFTTDDNTFTLDQTVIGSYDPNDITCLNGDKILLADVDKYLHYVIRFQNTGTASAISVVVKNILDNHLDWSTLQLESLSHDNRVAIKNGNELEFIFENIDLADSTTDEPNSHGFIAYKIKPKTDIALNDIISNKADIFFDYNSPIETNTVNTRIVNVLAVKENKLLDFSVYPTPTENILSVKSKTEISKIKIYSKLGQLILVNETENNIDISNLTQGLYFVKVEDVNGNFGVKKIMKK